MKKRKKKKKIRKVIYHKTWVKKDTIPRTDIHYLNLNLLCKYLNSRYEICSRVKNKLTRKEHFLIRKAIINARELQLLPHIKYS